MHRGGQSGATTQIQEGEEKAALCCARRHQTSVMFLFCCHRHVCKSQLIISKPHPTSGAAPASSCIPRRFPSRGEVTGPVAWNKQGTRCLRLHWPQELGCGSNSTAASRSWERRCPLGVLPPRLQKGAKRDLQAAGFTPLQGPNKQEGNHCYTQHGSRASTY